MTDKLFFYSRSRHVLPGQGKNEIIRDVKNYSVLVDIKDWRKILSHFHVYDFIHEGKTWRTIEHFFQSKKIEIVDPEKASWFTVESGHPIGQGDGSLARKNRKLVLLNKTDLQKWSVIQDKLLYEVVKSKMLQCEMYRRVVMGTHDAELWHVVPRGKPIRFFHVEKIRNEYQYNNNNNK